MGDDPKPRRRVRISGPVYDDSSVPLLRVEYEDGSAELLPPAQLRLFHPLDDRARPHPVHFIGRRSRLRAKRL